MKTPHLLFRPIALAASLLALASAAAVVLAAAQSQGKCPPIIASLFPKNAAIREGHYLPGDAGIGSGTADLSFENTICPKSKFSARMSIKVAYYGGELTALIKSSESPYGTIDRDAIKDEFVKSAMAELARTNLTPKKERLGIGEIVYVEYMSECPPEGQATHAARIGPMIVPNVKLRGVAWAGTASVEITLEGSLSVALAKAAVAEVFENLKKADFAKAK